MEIKPRKLVKCWSSNHFQTLEGNGNDSKARKLGDTGIDIDASSKGSRPLALTAQRRVFLHRIITGYKK